MLFGERFRDVLQISLVRSGASGRFEVSAVANKIRSNFCKWRDDEMLSALAFGVSSDLGE